MPAMRCAVVVLQEAEEGHTGVAYGETVVKMMSTMVYSGSNGFGQREAVTPRLQLLQKEAQRGSQKRAKPCGKQFEKKMAALKSLNPS